MLLLIGVLALKSDKHTAVYKNATLLLSLSQREAWDRTLHFKKTSHPFLPV